jgi:hypothetical protein
MERKWLPFTRCERYTSRYVKGNSPPFNGRTTNVSDYLISYRTFPVGKENHDWRSESREHVKKDYIEEKEAGSDEPFRAPVFFHDGASCSKGL